MCDPQPQAVNEFELTETKFLLTMPLGGRLALEYEVEGDNLYCGDAHGKIRFTNEGYGILRQEGTTGFDGRFIKLRK